MLKQWLQILTMLLVLVLLRPPCVTRQVTILSPWIPPSSREAPRLTGLQAFTRFLPRSVMAAGMDLSNCITVMQVGAGPSSRRWHPLAAVCLLHVCSVCAVLHGSVHPRCACRLALLCERGCGTEPSHACSPDSVHALL
jgi:hypothetical protein